MLGNNKVCPFDKTLCAKNKCMAYDEDKERCLFVEALIELRIASRTYRKRHNVYRVRRDSQ